MSRISLAAFIAMLALSGCVQEDEQVTMSYDANADDGGITSFGFPKNVNSQILEDINSDPKIVEVNLRAEITEVEYRDGVASKVWSYNGIVPGPVINAKVGDTLIVNFTNNLPEATTVHWHGVELPANMDGSFIAQKAVQPGGKFRYEFKLLRASTYWYHPHMRGNEQVELGLQGMLVVHDPKEDEALKLPKKEHLWVLDDVLLGHRGRLVEVGFPDNPAERAKTQANGREGNTLLVNGLVKPLIEWTIGEPQRIRVVNTANTRFMRISIPKHTLYRIGGDAGLLTAPVTVAPIDIIDIPEEDAEDMDMQCMNMNDGMDMDMGMDNDMAMEDGRMSDPDLSKGIFLTPGERADFIVVPHGDIGDTLNVQWHDYKRGRHNACIDVDTKQVIMEHMPDDGLLAPVTLLRIKLVQGGNADAVTEVNPEYQPPALLHPTEKTEVANASILPITFGHMEPDENGDINFFVTMLNDNGIGFKDITAEMAERVNVNDIRIIEVKNTAMGDHNFHLHGFMFQLIETEYVDLDVTENNKIIPAPILEFKDTIHIPRSPGMEEDRSWSITRLAIHFSDEGREGQVMASGKIPTDTTSGGWLYHCHILEHADQGMASFIQVF